MVLVQLRWTSDLARFRCKRSLSRCARWLCKIIFSGIAFTRDRTQHPCREDSRGRIAGIASSLTRIEILRTMDGKITRRHISKLISAENKDLLISSLSLVLLLEITSDVASVFPFFDYWNENLKSMKNTSFSLTRSLSRISLLLFPHDFSLDIFSQVCDSDGKIKWQCKKHPRRDSLSRTLIWRKFTGKIYANIDNIRGLLKRLATGGNATRMIN